MVTFIVDPRTATTTRCDPSIINQVRHRVGQDYYEVSFYDDELNEYTGTVWPWEHTMHTFEFAGALYYGKHILVVDQAIRAEEVPIAWGCIPL